MTASFPSTRLRRTRRHGWLRALVAENRLSPADLIWPVFVKEGEGVTEPVASMPGVCRYSLDRLIPEVARAQAAGIPAIAVFPAVEREKKTLLAEESYNPQNLICRTVRALKAQFPETGVICDVALDPYTIHGHDGLWNGAEVDNDATISILCRQAVTQAQAGCDIVAPSDMMDGRVAAIREALDGAGLESTGILAYAAKYASAFYGPFRDAVGSRSTLGGADKRGYQMDPANACEALREVEHDIREGADMVMVKPGLPYLDIIRRVKDAFPVPVFAYQVSGEYTMLKAAAGQGAFDFHAAMEESLIACKRAGASAIFTYAAIEMAERLREASL